MFTMINESDYTYRLFKHKFYKKYGDLGEHGEMILFHGTDKCNIQGILNDDFSLTVSKPMDISMVVEFISLIVLIRHYIIQREGMMKNMYLCV